MITIARCYTIFEANSLKIALDANGIESFIPDETMAITAPYMVSGKAGVRIQVAEEDEEQAKAVIAEARES